MAITENPRLILTPMEVARLLGLGKNTTYDAIRRGDIPAIRVGKRLLVPRAALEEWLAGRGSKDQPTKSGHV